MSLPLLRELKTATPRRCGGVSRRPALGGGFSGPSGGWVEVGDLEAGCGCPVIERKGVASASERCFRIKLQNRGPRGWKREVENHSIQPLHPAPSNWPARSRSTTRCHGISISNFRIPNSVWGMGGRQRQGQGIGHPGSDLVGHVSSDGGGDLERPGRGAGGVREWIRETGGIHGPLGNEKAPQGEPYGASNGNGNLRRWLGSRLGQWTPSMRHTKGREAATRRRGKGRSSDTPSLDPIAV